MPRCEEAGGSRARPRFPAVLGTDGAGNVAAVGSRVRRLQVGETVYAYSFNNAKGGFYAEYVVVAAANAAPVPDGMGLKHAGAIPTTGLTALQGVEDALKTKGGDSLIIHGASGGVGTMAVQFAKARGARVLAIASGADGKALARRLASRGRPSTDADEDILAAARDVRARRSGCRDGVCGRQATDAVSACAACGWKSCVPERRRTDTAKAQRDRFHRV